MRRALGRFVFWLACGACVVSIGGASAQTLSCTPPQKPMLDVEFLLGRGKAHFRDWLRFIIQREDMFHFVVQELNLMKIRQDLQR